MKSRAKSKSIKALTAADLYWSDDDEDPLRKYVLQVEAPPVDQSDDDDSNAAVFRLQDETTEEASVLHEDHLSEHKRSMLFQGYVHVDRNKVVKLFDTSKPVVAQHQQQYPQVSSQTRHKLGDRVLTLLWKYFIDCGCDASELLQMHHLPRISKLLEDNYNVSLPFSKIKQVKLLEPDDYASFSDVADQLSHHYVKPVVVLEPSDRLCQLCCTYGACRHKLERRMEDGGQSPDMQPDSNREYVDSQKYLESNEHKLNIIYTQLMVNLNGRLRIKNIVDILRELSIAFDKQRLPRLFWDNRGELLVASLDELRELIETLRTDREGVVDPYAGLYKYELPGWLREEFQDSEVLLYEHHFSLIDLDQGGSVDVDELQQLIGSFGGFISRDDAQALLDAYDLDGGGTIGRYYNYSSCALEMITTR
jgi:Ca2+-binding EF-hand superfamily protein